jgi:hypothetical protein
LSRLVSPPCPQCSTWWPSIRKCRLNRPDVVIRPGASTAAAASREFGHEGCPLRQYHPPVTKPIVPSTTIPGATTDWSLTPADFDLDHGVSANSELLWRLAAEAYEGDYPSEIQPWGFTTWWVLGRAICGLKVGPGQTLVDLGCGRGKPGLWLSRATGASLVGIDWSPVAVRIAPNRRKARMWRHRARARARAAQHAHIACQQNRLRLR